MSVSLAAAATGFGLLLLLPPQVRLADRGWTGWVGWAGWVCVVVLGAAVLGGVPGSWARGGGGLAPVPLVVIVSGACWAVRQELRRRQRRAAADLRADAVVEFCDGLAADLRAGQPPSAALAAGAAEWPELRGVADAGRMGGDVPAAFRVLARRDGAQGLESVAAAWAIAHRSGTGLADAVSLAGRVVRESRASARLVESELAAARATARMLAVLPFGVLLIGRGAGGDPFGFLLGTTAGTICLGLGLALVGAGLAWLERIARSVHG